MAAQGEKKFVVFLVQLQHDLVALVPIAYDTSYRRGVEQLGSSLGS